VTRTFLDAGVLIAAARGSGVIAVRAHTILDDPERVFVTSDYIRMECCRSAVLPAESRSALVRAVLFESRTNCAVFHLADEASLHRGVYLGPGSRSMRSISLPQNSARQRN